MGMILNRDVMGVCSVCVGHLGFTDLEIHGVQKLGGRKHGSLSMVLESTVRRSGKSNAEVGEM